jgi:TonB family protein
MLMKKYLIVLALCAVLQPATARDVAAHIVPGSCPLPIWPPAALRALETGATTVGFMVDEGNTLRETTIITSSGSEALDRASMEALNRCKFNAATGDGKPIAAWGRMQYKWTLDHSKGQHAALAAFEDRARQGSAKDQLMLGQLYLGGHAGKSLVETGAQWLRRAADQGLADAQVALALHLHPSQRWDEAPAESVDLLRLAAAQDHPKAQFLLSRIMERQGKSEQAQLLFDRALAQQYPTAMYLAGKQLLNSGRNEDLPRAIALLQQAAAKGDRNAHWQLAECYAMGLGVQHDDALAATHLQQAALAPIPAAQHALAQAYETGTGIPQNAALAKLWRDTANANSKRRSAAAKAN